ncbi:hypothetical protein ACFYU9_35270 [Streptomyces sp. NPDC004327]|uniref:hypothetical protein n=1 Tax=Streptomyces sp. NPDC004327 TaxID=3364699 RepID=UPI0036A5F4D6
MNTAAIRTGRSYTLARTFPWVLGKIGDFVLWLGPYNAPQLIILGAGVFLLIKTFFWWAPLLGPVPVMALGFTVWAARASRIGGRAPLWVAYGLLQRALQPASGRIGGHTARPAAAHSLTGSFLIERTGPHMAPHPRRSSRCTTPLPAQATKQSSRPVTARGPVPTPLQQLLHTRVREESAR